MTFGNESCPVPVLVICSEHAKLLYNYDSIPAVISSYVIPSFAVGRLHDVRSEADGVMDRLT